MRRTLPTTIEVDEALNKSDTTLANAIHSKYVARPVADSMALPS